MATSDVLTLIVTGAGSSIAGAVALATFLRSRTKVVLEAKAYPFDLPPMLDKVLEAGHDALLGRTHAYTPGSLPPAVNLLLDQVAAAESAGYIHSRRPTLYWHLRLLNRGHENVEDIRITVSGSFIAIITTGHGTTTTLPGAILELPELRPGQEVRVNAWARSSLNEAPAVSLKKGRAKVVTFGMLPAPLATFYSLWRLWGPVVILSLSISAVLAIVTLYLLIRGIATAHT